MTQNSSFIRKIVYGCGIVLLLFPLFLLGQPATRSSGNTAGSPGGKLAQMRSKFGLSQAELGQIDPASETMKMATLGLRGVATNLLWTKANEYKRTENWDKLSATLNQIAKLQPNYITVWEFQAHNLSYNVSAEFDNYRHRFHWVKKGIEFLIEGTQYNQRNPRLLWNLGWFTGQKIGRADEHVQFRRMFRTDTDFHDVMVDHINIDQARGPNGYPDNWLAGNLWFLRSHAVVDEGIPVTWLRIDPQEEGLTDKRRSPVVFYADPSMALIDHAEAITSEITPGEKTRNAWKIAGDSWAEYGSTDIATTFGFSVRLNERDETAAEKKRMIEQLDALQPGLREQIAEERRQELTNQERNLIDNPPAPETMSPDEFMLLQETQSKLDVTDQQVANRVPESQRAKARHFAARANKLDSMLTRIENYRMIVNYPYWETRCQVEQSEQTATARRLMMLGDQAAKNGDPDQARRHYEQAWDEWAMVFEQYPQLVDDAMADDLIDPIVTYRSVLEQLDEEFPRDFKLNSLLEAQGQTSPAERLPEQQSEEPAEADQPAAEEAADEIDAETSPENGVPSAIEDPSVPAEKKDAVNSPTGSEQQ